MQFRNESCWSYETIKKARINLNIRHLTILSVRTPGTTILSVRTPGTTILSVQTPGTTILSVKTPGTILSVKTPVRLNSEYWAPLGEGF